MKRKAEGQKEAKRNRHTGIHTHQKTQGHTTGTKAHKDTQRHNETQRDKKKHTETHRNAL